MKENNISIVFSFITFQIFITKLNSFSLLRYRSTFAQRHSHNFISEGIKSDLKEQNTCLMHYERTEWVEFFSSSTQIDFFTQTLNTLNLEDNQIGAQGAKDLSDALRVNTVSRIFSSSTQQTQMNFFAQTFNTLYLDDNQIGTQGAKHLYDALRLNRVSRIFSSSTQKTQIDFFAQTLTELNVWSHQIGDQGAKYLSDALRVNTVSRIFFSSTQIDFFTQILNTFDLSWNQIGDQEAQDLADALPVNTMSRIFSSSTQKTQIDLFKQTFNTVHLQHNQIGNKLMTELNQLIERNAKWWLIESARRLENSVSINILLFSISASFCTFNQIMKNKFSSTIDNFSRGRFCILFNE